MPEETCCHPHGSLYFDRFRIGKDQSDHICRRSPAIE